MLSQTVSDRASELHNYKHLLTPSQYYADVYSEAFCLDIKSIKLGIHLDDFGYRNKEYRDNNKTEYNILFPARFQTKQKGHDIAIKAGVILKSLDIPFKIIFTGVKDSSQKYFKEFFKLVNDHDMIEHVLVKTYADINVAYAECDLVIAPEKYCSYGLSISESVALGIPTILSDIPTYQEIARGYKNAVFFSSESAEDLANKILRCLKTDIVRNRSEAIRFRINNDLRDCAKAYAKLYLDLVKI